MSHQKLKLRPISKEDAPIIHKAFQQQGWEKPIAQYERYFEYQAAGIRAVIIAEVEEEFAGYLTIAWAASYLPFREKNIPEIIDFNVLQKFQRQGVGTRLMDEAERRIEKVSKYAGIGFGLTKDYGAAQILYINRHYIPDGNGLVKDSKPLDYGEEVVIGHDLVFYLLKEL